MTEYDWLTGGDEYRRYHFLATHPSERKTRLFVVECLSAVAHLLRDPRGTAALTVLTDYVDGRVSVEALEEASFHAGEAYSEMILRPHHPVARWAANAISMACCLSPPHIAEAPGYCLDAITEESPTEESGKVARQVEDARQSTLLRDIFGNPFRPVTFDPRWRSETAVALAAGIYEGRAFDRLPILADALEEAGCAHPDVLAHCRGVGPHVRGCWVVDAVLNKA
jgi:hypothetical protein